MDGDSAAPGDVADLSRRQAAVSWRYRPLVARFLLDPEVPGEMGPDTVLDTSVHPPVVHHLSLVLMPGSAGDDLATTWPCYVVTERLASAIDASDLLGARWGDVDVRLDEQFRSAVPEQAASLPTAWRRLLADDDAGADLCITGAGDLVVTERALALLRRFRLESCDVSRVGQVP